ncbi:MAG: hypothetical protein GY861_25570 [bacterium]|nr:hypothetical protein [bacterium]
MIWYYLFMIILIVGTIVGLSTLISQHWNNVLAQLRNKAEGGDIPHTIDRRPRYLEQENLSEKMLGDQPVEGGGQQGGGDRARGGIPHSPKGGTNSMRMRDN